MTRKKDTFSVLILLLLFVFNYTSSNFFLHTHTIDGEKIVHSHPYSSDTHSHSRSALDVISNLNRSLFLFEGLLVLSVAVTQLAPICSSELTFFVRSRGVIYRIPRAPPVC